MSSWATPGVKVVCLDDRPRKPQMPHIEYVGGMDGLTAGQVYTLREVFVDPDEKDIQVKLVEIWRPIHRDENTGREAGYSLKRFRPLISTTQEQDMKIFHPLLKVKENV